MASRQQHVRILYERGQVIVREITLSENLLALGFFSLRTTTEPPGAGGCQSITGGAVEEEKGPDCRVFAAVPRRQEGEATEQSRDLVQPEVRRPRATHAQRRKRQQQEEGLSRQGFTARRLRDIICRAQFELAVAWFLAPGEELLVAGDEDEEEEEFSGLTGPPSVNERRCVGGWGRE